MRNIQLTTPVAFIIFNRPETTSRVFNVIREAQPSQLYVIADGPRYDHPQDIKKCAAVREIIRGVDWNCEVFTNYSDKNLGCKKRLPSGLDWVFEHVEQAIILEDDCLPHPTFFRYCQELLEYYKNDERVMVISGDNFQFGNNQSEYSYYFSRYNHCWGWATWKRAWKHFDQNMELWPQIRDKGLLDNILENNKTADYWTKIFNITHAGENNAWDYALTYACWVQNGLSIIPKGNLVSNIGFGDDATHTFGESIFADIETIKIEFPLAHPPYLIRNVNADRFTQLNHYGPGRLLKRLRKKLMRFVNYLKEYN